MTILKNLDQQVSSLVVDETNPRSLGTQFSTFVPVMPAGTTPILPATKGARLGSPGVLPPGFAKATQFIAHPDQRNVFKDGLYVGGRPRCMGNIPKTMPRDPLPDGTPQPGPINGQEGQDTWYEGWLYIPSDYVIPMGNGGVPSVWFAWHGESGPDPLAPAELVYDYPPFQFHMKRLAKNAKQSCYVKMLGGKTKPQSAGPPVGWTAEGVNSHPSGGTGNYYLETMREYDLFPGVADAPRGRWIYFRWHIVWTHLSANGLFEMWIDGTDNAHKVIDSRTTVPAVGPAVPANGGATIFQSDSTGYVQDVGHIEVGYYRPQEGPNSSLFFPGVWDQSFWQTGILITSSSADLIGPAGPAGGGGGGPPPTGLFATAHFDYSIFSAPSTKQINSLPAAFAYDLAQRGPSLIDSLLARVVWSIGAVVPPPVVDDPLRPTVDAVALLLRTRTVGDIAGGLGGDVQVTDITTFTDTTRPKRSDVLGLINVAYDLLRPRIFVPIDANAVSAVRQAVAVQAAMLVEQSFFREQSSDESMNRWTTMLDLLIDAINRVDDQGQQRRYGFGMLDIGTIRHRVAPIADDFGV